MYNEDQSLKCKKAMLYSVINPRAFPNGHLSLLATDSFIQPLLIGDSQRKEPFHVHRSIYLYRHQEPETALFIDFRFSVQAVSFLASE